jgi:hypothetical protein
MLLWIVGNTLSRIAGTITIDRDVAAGWRAFGFFVGGGLILGRAVAGDWHSAGETVVDCAVKGWTILPLWAAVVLIDVICRPTPLRPAPNAFFFGLVPCLLYAALAVGAVALLGPW